MFVVAKFGGSSLSSYEMFQKVKSIVTSDPKRQVVVVSALGKRDSNDTKITDLLYILHAHIMYSVPYDEIWAKIQERYVDIKKSLKLNFDIEHELDIIKSKLNKSISEDYLISRGEYLTARLMSDFLGFEFVDAADVIVFDYNGKLDFDKTEEKLKPYEDKKILVPGFYGAYPNGNVKLFSRGGSDITGSVLAKCLKASLYENWTDVSGILMADPRIIKNPLPISNVTYTELRELSYMGANVIHEETIFPIQDMNIPINIRNTNDPDNKGTIISSVSDSSGSMITGIAGKKDFMAFTISKSHMSNEVGFLRKALSIFEKYGISIEHVPSGIDTATIVVATSQVEKYLYEVVADLKHDLEADVSVEKGIALIAVVGKNMANKHGLSGKLFGIIGTRDINVKLIAQGPQELNIIIGVSNSDYESAIRAIYDELVIK